MQLQRDLQSIIEEVEAEVVRISVGDWTLIKAEIGLCEQRVALVTSECEIVRADREALMHANAAASERIVGLQADARIMRDYYQRGVKKLFWWLADSGTLSEHLSTVADHATVSDMKIALSMSLGVPFDWIDLLLAEVGLSLPEPHTKEADREV